MGARGPLRQPNSIRGQIDRKHASKIPANSAQASATPLKPEWLPTDAAATWDAIIADLQAAGVPLQRIDAHAIAMFVMTITEARKAALAGDSKLAARLGRDVIAWSSLIGATPAARARLNIQPKVEPPPNDPWAQFK